MLDRYLHPLVHVDAHEMGTDRSYYVFLSAVLRAPGQTDNLR